MSRLLPAFVLSLLAPACLLAGEARIETAADGRSWTLTNGLVERRVARTDEDGLRMASFRRVTSGEGAAPEVVVRWQAPVRARDALEAALGGEDAGPFEVEALREGETVPLPGPGRVSLFEARRSR